MEVISTLIILFEAVIAAEGSLTCDTFETTSWLYFSTPKYIVGRIMWESFYREQIVKKNIEKFPISIDIDARIDE